MKLQVDVPDDINIQLKIYKLKHKFVTIAEVVNNILAEKFAEEVKGKDESKEEAVEAIELE